MISVDLNCDLGEGAGNDKAVMPFISSANIACGYHAGDDGIMDITIDLAKKNNVSIGAHPGYDDKENFGRLNMDLSSDEIYNLVKDQILILKSKVERAGVKINHVKPHGALYNQAAADYPKAEAIAKAIYDVDAKLIYFGLVNSEMEKAASRYNLSFASEVFADRAYTNQGSLVPRSQDGAVIHDPEMCKHRVLLMVKDGIVKSVEGQVVEIKADTICVHGDNPEAIALARSIYQHLKQNNIKIQSSPIKGFIKKGSIHKTGGSY